VKRDGYKPGYRGGRSVASMSFALNKEKLTEYVGRLREWTSFYEKLL
jgi:hypothetical protein